MQEHLFTYTFAGERYSFAIPAESENEARNRVKAIGATATYDGELVATIPAVVGTWAPSLFVRFMNWIRG